MGCEQAQRLLSELQKKPRDSAGIAAQTDEHRCTGNVFQCYKKTFRKGNSSRNFSQCILFLQEIGVYNACCPVLYLFSVFRAAWCVYSQSVYVPLLLCARTVFCTYEQYAVYRVRQTFIVRNTLDCCLRHRAVQRDDGRLARIIDGNSFEVVGLKTLY